MSDSSKEYRATSRSPGSPHARKTAGRPTRARLRTVARWAGRLTTGVVAVTVLGAATIYGTSEPRMRRHFVVPAHPLAAANATLTSAELTARGRHLATVRGCVDCHGDALGGRVFVDNPAAGRFAGANLTRGGRGAMLTDADWERAVRHGVRRDGTPLIVMPANEFTGMSDEDLAAIVAYARSLPAAHAVQPPTTVEPVLRAFAVAGKTSLAAEQIDHARAHPARVTAEPSARYGAYLATGCTGCHGMGFSGGPIPGGPPDWKPAANLTPAGVRH